MSFSEDKKGDDKEEEEGEGIRKARRFAVLVGVNKYQDYDQIPTLAGAENDAEELRKRLITNNDFEVLDGHLLLGEHATRTAILRAVSDIFRNDRNTELVLFYFSGHGVVDENQEGYIAPYDMYPKDPFVSGIRMEDLKYLIERSNSKTNAAIILDCCYAGIATKDTKALPAENKKHLYSIQLQKLGQTQVQDAFKPRRAKFILASSEGDAVSRERNECVHADIIKPPHAHGVFSFHLIEGLNGAAAQPDTGIITFDSLRKYIEDKMMEEKKQKPMYALAEASLLEYISLGTRQEVFVKNVSQLITDIRNLTTKGNESQMFLDIRHLSDAVKKIRNLSTVDPNNMETPSLITSINHALQQYQAALFDWLIKNTMIAGTEIDKIRPDLYNQHFYEICDNLNYEGFQKLNELDLVYLVHLSPEIKDNTEYTSKDQKRLQRLVLRLDAVTKLGKLGQSQAASK
jgi:hypothetical protein